MVSVIGVDGMTVSAKDYALSNLCIQTCFGATDTTTKLKGFGGRINVIELQCRRVSIEAASDAAFF